MDTQRDTDSILVRIENPIEFFRDQKHYKCSDRITIKCPFCNNLYNANEEFIATNLTDEDRKRIKELKKEIAELEMEIAALEDQRDECYDKLQDLEESISTETIY